MRIETVFYLVAPGDRPPYGWVSDHLWGSEANVDSDGNSRTPDDTQWTELSLILRGAGEAEVHIDPITSSPLILQIRSPDGSLAQRVATFLSQKTKGNIESSMPNSQC